MGANPLRVSLLILLLTQTMLSLDLVEGLHGFEDYDEEYQRMQNWRSGMKNGGLLRLLKSLDVFPQPQYEHFFLTGPGRSLRSSQMERVTRGEKMSEDQPGFTGYSQRIMRSPLKSGKIMLNL